MSDNFDRLDEIKMKIQQAGSGVDNHTRAKAMYYLNKWHERKGSYDEAMYLGLFERCEKALMNGDWSYVRNLLLNKW